MAAIGRFGTRVVPELPQILQECRARKQLVQGPYIERFEHEFARVLGSGHVRMCSTEYGRMALYFILKSMEFPPDSEIIVPAFTFWVVPEIARVAGLKPVFADIDPTTFTLSPQAVERAITPRTRAILPTHLYGLSCDMDPILDIARRHSLKVIEDCAQSHYAEWQGQRVGTFGDAATFSFYPGKNLGAYGDAGAVLTVDSDVARRVRLMRDHGSERKYEHDIVGWNSRLDTLQAIVLQAKLRRLARWNEARRAAAARYDVLLAEVPHVRVPATMPGNVPVWHLYVVRVPERDRVLAALQAAGIGASIHYPTPIHLTGAYRGLGYGPGSFPVAEAAAEEILTLPLYPHITLAQQEHIAAELDEALR